MGEQVSWWRSQLRFSKNSIMYQAVPRFVGAVIVLMMTASMSVAAVSRPFSAGGNSSFDNGGSLNQASRSGGSGGGGGSTIGGGNHADYPEFKVYDATFFAGRQSDMSSFGILPVSMYYEWSFWQVNGQVQNTGQLPNRDRIASLGREANARGIPAILDIEHLFWPSDWYDQQQVYYSLMKYLAVYNVFKANAPDIEVGYYGMPVGRDYWNAIYRGTPQYQRWQNTNNWWRPLADRVDISIPSLYTFYDDRQQWVSFAKANIDENFRLLGGRDTKKRVLVFLMPTYHPNGNPNYVTRYVAADYWRLQLETVCNPDYGADGIVIWGGETLVNGRHAGLPWDSNAAWWQVTQQFMREVSSGQRRCGRNNATNNSSGV